MLLKWVQNVFILAASILIGLLVMDVIAAVVPSPYEHGGSSTMVCSKELGWVGRANYNKPSADDDKPGLVLNSAGMHDTEHTWSRIPDEYRILMIGDSFVRAAQVTEVDTSHQVLEALLDGQVPQRRVEVVSAGVDAWGTGQELTYYREIGRRYQADLVILMFYLDNDLGDNLPGRCLTVNGRNCYSPYYVLCSGALQPAPWRYAPGFPPSAGDCAWHKRVLGAVFSFIHDHSKLYTRIEPLLPDTAIHLDTLEYYTGRSPVFDYSTQLTVALLEQMQVEVKRDDAQFLVVLISPKGLVHLVRMNPEQRAAFLLENPALATSQNIPSPNEYMRGLLTSEGIDVLDLLPCFVSHMDETGEDLFLAHDSHWNIAGNHQAAVCISEWILAGHSGQE